MFASPASASSTRACCFDALIIEMIVAATDIVPSAAESVLAYPYKAPKKKSREEHVAVSVLTRDAGGERVHLLVQRPDKGT